MNARSLRLAVAALPFVLAAGCGGPGAEPAARAASEGPDPAVAEINGAPIRLSEVDERARGRLQRLEDEEYEIRRAALDEIIAERLLEAEARQRGVTREALIEAEIQGKLSRPSEEEVRTVYERARGRLGGMTLEQVRDQIVASLMEQGQAERAQAFRQHLREKADVEVRLAQPRLEVALPEDALAQGPKDAPITMVEFLDYQCPYCHRVQPLVDEIMARYPGKVRFVQREFLLDKPRSLPTARAVRCAAEQGRFWEYHRHLLMTPGDFSDQDLRHRASAVGLDVDRFGTCLATDRYDEAIHAASRQGAELGVTGTPTFFINGRRLSGVRPVDQYAEIIDAELNSPS